MSDAGSDDDEPYVDPYAYDSEDEEQQLEEEEYVENDAMKALEEQAGKSITMMTCNT